MVVVRAGERERQSRAGKSSCYSAVLCRLQYFLRRGEKKKFIAAAKNEGSSCYISTFASHAGKSCCCFYDSPKARRRRLHRPRQNENPRPLFLLLQGLQTNSKVERKKERRQKLRRKGGHRTFGKNSLEASILYMYIRAHTYSFIYTFKKSATCTRSKIRAHKKLHLDVGCVRS